MHSVSRNVVNVEIKVTLHETESVTGAPYNIKVRVRPLGKTGDNR